MNDDNLNWMEEAVRTDATVKELQDMCENSVHEECMARALRALDRLDDLTAFCGENIRLLKRIRGW